MPQQCKLRHDSAELGPGWCERMVERGAVMFQVDRISGRNSSRKGRLTAEQWEELEIDPLSVFDWIAENIMVPSGTGKYDIKAHAADDTKNPFETRRYYVIADNSPAANVPKGLGGDAHAVAAMGQSVSQGLERVLSKLDSANDRNAATLAMVLERADINRDREADLVRYYRDQVEEYRVKLMQAQLELELERAAGGVDLNQLGMAVLQQVGPGLNTFLEGLGASFAPSKAVPPPAPAATPGESS